MTKRQHDPASPIGSQAVPAGPAIAGDISAVQKALKGLSDSFATDGYSMTVAGMERGRVKIVIEAGEGACAECLVPQEIMANIVRSSLPPSCGVSDIDLVYPRSSE